MRGQDGRDVLAAVGYSDEELDAMTAAGALLVAEPGPG